MVRLRSWIFISLIAALTVFLAGCGGSGKSQKISGVADEESQVLDEARASQKEALPSTYMVEAGDTLWSVAGKPQIYGNQQQWPLIYDANRDILDDYKKPLEEGVKLIIPRNVSAVEIAAAKQKAVEYCMPPGSGKKAVKKESDYENEQDSVAGMGTVAVKPKKTGSSSAADFESEYMEEEAPTPIPEPVKSKKKGKSNNMLLLLAAAGVLLMIIIFIVSKQKKKEDEDEGKEDSNTKTNILD